jgi:hypothetical protein
MDWVESSISGWQIHPNEDHRVYNAVVRGMQNGNPGVEGILRVGVSASKNISIVCGVQFYAERFK